MANPYFAKTTLLLACIFGSIAASSSVNAQVYTDSTVEEMANRQGLTKELETKRRMLAQVQVAPSKIELRKLGGSKVSLAPYCTIELGEQASQTEWMVNKTPPLFIATVKDAGTIIFTVLPAQGPEVTAELLYQTMVKKFRGKMKTLDASPFRQLSTTQGEGTISGELAEGNKFKVYLRIVNLPEFAMMVQGFSDTPEKEKVIKQIINTMKFDPSIPAVASSSPESRAFIRYGNSRLIVTNPKGLVRGTDDFPELIAEMNSQSPFKVNDVFVLPAATEVSRQVNGLYRHADVRAAGSMTLPEFNNVRKEFEAAVNQRVSIAPQVELTGIVKLEDTNVFCFTHRGLLPTMTRIGVTALCFHDGQVFQFCIHSDARTEADETWAKETMKDWLRSIRQANSIKKVAAK